MHTRSVAFLTLFTFGVVGCDSAPSAPSVPLMVAEAADPSIGPESLSPVEDLGLRIFNDRKLSLNKNQSCVDCHDPCWGFSAPRSVVNAGTVVMPGSEPTRLGSRRPPSAAYASVAPIRFFDVEGDVWVGGNFWDGRATGARLGNPAAEQALAPFLNPVEQALPDLACVLYRITHGSYQQHWSSVFGNAASSIAWPSNTDALCAQEGTSVPLSSADRAIAIAEYDNVGHAVAAFEGSERVNRFSSKFDAVMDGVATFTAEEQRGLAVFNGKGNCAACHPSEGRHALFTDFTFDNIGVPSNPKNPAVIANPQFQDLGLGASVGDPAFDGAQKVPTLRNTDRRGPAGGTKAFMHNGFFKSLESVIRFYSTRDVLPRCETVAKRIVGETCWPAPEVDRNVNGDELGNLGLTTMEIRDLAAFIRTLNDGYYKPVLP